MQNSRWCRKPSRTRLLAWWVFLQFYPWKGQDLYQKCYCHEPTQFRQRGDYSNDYAILTLACSLIHCCPSVCVALYATMETTKWNYMTPPTNTSETTRQRSRQLPFRAVRCERRKHQALQEPSGQTWSPNLRGQRKGTLHTLRINIFQQEQSEHSVTKPHVRLLAHSESPLPLLITMS